VSLSSSKHHKDKDSPPTPTAHPKAHCNERYPVVLREPIALGKESSWLAMYWVMSIALNDAEEAYHDSENDSHFADVPRLGSRVSGDWGMSDTESGAIFR
jgi:hypothetical protein